MTILSLDFCKRSIEEKQTLWQLLDVELKQTSDIKEDVYDWGVEGQPKSKPVEYIPELGLVVIGGKND